MTLMEIREEQQALNKLYEKQIDEETGELLDGEVIEQLQLEINNHLVNKSGGIINVIKFKEANINAIDEEIKRLQYIKKVKNSQMDNFKNYIKINMLALGLEKIETELGNLSLRKSTSTEIDENVIDEKYGTIVQTIKYNKTEISKLLKNGEEITGAKLVENKSLQIK